MAKVGVFMGSASDEDLMKPCAEVLDSLGIDYLFTVSSAHRTPERTEKLVAELEAGGCQVFVCAAGMAAHLAGAVAARTTRPVIGVPLAASLFKSIPVIGITAGAATISIMGGSTTYALGWVFDRHFRKGGCLIDFDAEEAKTYFKEKVEEGKNFVGKLKKKVKKEAAEAPAEDTATEAKTDAA